MNLIGCVCLIAGTAIGAGTIALPITLAKFGLVYGSLIMLGTWAICYFSALLNLELNLRAGRGMPLGALSLHFSGLKAYLAGSSSLLLLCYSLLCAYIYGATSTLLSLDGFTLSFNQTALGFAVFIGLLMTFSLKKVDYINRFLFISLISIVFILLFGIMWQLDFSKIPLATTRAINYKDITIAIPIVFTSFGFQVIFHTLVNSTNSDAALLKKAFFWGSLIPAIIYITWTTCICSLVCANAPEVFQKMLYSGIEVGEMVKTLSHTSGSPLVQYLVWTIGFLAILTSALGTLIGLVDTLKTKHPTLNNHKIGVLAALLPAILVSLLVPNAFIKALGFAGMILSFMALLLPMYLLYCAHKSDKKGKYWYPILQNPLVLVTIVGYGLWVILSEAQNIFGF